MIYLQDESHCNCPTSGIKFDSKTLDLLILIRPSWQFETPFLVSCVIEPAIALNLHGHLYIIIQCVKTYPILWFLYFVLFVNG